MIDWSQEKRQAGTKGLHLNVPSKAYLLSEIKEHLNTAKGFSVATLNLDHVVKIRDNVAFRTAYGLHSHITADGNPIVWLSRLSGQEVQLVPGSELIDPLAEIAAELSVPVGFFGATQASLEHAKTVLEQRYPGLQVAACIAPEMGFDPTGPEAQAYVDTLIASGARLCFLALGAPKQELFAIKLCQANPHMGAVSIGAGLDFISGAQKRAPKLARILAAEWLWRLLGNPKRLGKRYWDCIVILPGLLIRALRNRVSLTSSDVR